jgi:hypothetical protein
MIIAGHLLRGGYRPRGIVHVGAHAAQEMPEYLALNPQIIVWIEADPEVYTYLVEKVVTPTLQAGPPRQLCLNALIGARDGDAATFHRFSNWGATAIVPAGTTFPALLRELVISLSVLRNSVLRRPVELGSVDPHAVQNDRKLSRDGDLGLAEAVSFGELGSPSLKRRPFWHAGQQHTRRLEQIHAQHRVTAL